MSLPHQPVVSPVADNREPLTGLNEGAHILIWALRQVAVSTAWQPLIDFEFRRVFRKHGADLRAAFIQFLGLVARLGRRKLSLGLPGLPVLTRDEQSILAALTAAQDQDGARLMAHLRWILARDDVMPVCPGFYAIGGILLLNGHDLGNLRTAPEGQIQGQHVSSGT